METIYHYIMCGHQPTNQYRLKPRNDGISKLTYDNSIAAIDPIVIMVAAIAEAIINLFFSTSLAPIQHTYVYRITIIKTILKHIDEELPILLRL
jgi:hypothetical protein